MNMGQVQEEQVRIARNKMYADRGGSASISWEPVTSVFQNVPREKLAQAVTDYLLQTKSRVPETLLQGFADQSSRENYIKSAIINVMSTPEYQMC